MRNAPKLIKLRIRTVFWNDQPRATILLMQNTYGCLGGILV